MKLETLLFSISDDTQISIFSELKQKVKKEQKISIYILSFIHVVTSLINLSLIFCYIFGEFDYVESEVQSICMRQVRKCDKYMGNPIEFIVPEFSSCNITLPFPKLNFIITFTLYLLFYQLPIFIYIISKLSILYQLHLFSATICFIFKIFIFIQRFYITTNGCKTYFGTDCDEHTVKLLNLYFALDVFVFILLIITYCFLIIRSFGNKFSQINISPTCSKFLNYPKRKAKLANELKDNKIREELTTLLTHCGYIKKSAKLKK